MYIENLSLLPGVMLWNFLWACHPVPTVVCIDVSTYDSVSIRCRDISHNQLEMVGRKTLTGIPALKNL
jgi:hypothetical protein